jgi:hypothetical protein
MKLLQILRESIKNWLSDQNEQYHKKKEEQEQQIQLANNLQMQMELQKAMADVMVNQTISPLLNPLKSRNDLIPDGYQTTSCKPVFFFHWLKRSEDRIPYYLLEKMTKQMNHAIWLYRFQFIAYAADLIPIVREEFFRNNWMHCNGFHVIQIKDDVDAIIIAVSID